MENFVITQCRSAFLAHDPAGRKTGFENRQFACFIVTVKGKIRFTYDGGSLIARAGAPVFLPRGLSYLNECLETAESYVFNFHTLESDHRPMQLSAISDSLIAEYYERIRSASDSAVLSDRLSALAALYSLAARLLGNCAKDDNLHPIVKKALYFISQNYESADITVRAVAKHCLVSEVYLRKLFEKELHVSPSRKITEMRMKKARMLVDEKRPLKEI
ncbi:MAG: hypothetical protein J6B55_04405, partial [Clostridia bacterium]|nr:hypothetical protein [Clostridia bacterium]